MINDLRLLIQENWQSFGLPGTCSLTELQFTKFCQRVVQPHTKVLFFVTHQGNPLCILKIMRSDSYNGKLKNEKEAQERMQGVHNISTAHVFFDGMAGDRYVYAEEVVLGTPISRREARKREQDIVMFISRFPHKSEQSAVDVAAVLKHHAPDHAGFLGALEILSTSGVVLPLGLTHGDLGRPNILWNKGELKVIDWERANDLPFRFIDAVYFMSQIRNARTLDTWRAIALSDFSRYTGLDEKTGTALFAACQAFLILYRKYPEQYREIVTILRDRTALTGSGAT